MAKHEEVFTQFAHQWQQEKMPKLIDELVESCADGFGVNHNEYANLPDRVQVDNCLDMLFMILFPGFVNSHIVTTANLKYHLGDIVNHVLIELSREVEKAIRHTCRITKCDSCNAKGDAERSVAQLIEALPKIREMIKDDVRAGHDGDPAAQSVNEVILSYPSIEAVSTYRLAHELYLQKIPMIPRLWSERAHSRTGIDINPGAKIGSHFFIDHGTGVVIGETCEIGSHVQLYQGVTLGALAPAKGHLLSGKKRHPTIEDNVVIYAGATILGGNTVIGNGCVIGGNVWLTESVPAGTKVLLPKSELLFLRPGKHNQPRPEDFQCPAKPFCEADGTIPIEKR